MKGTAHPRHSETCRRTFLILLQPRQSPRLTKLYAMEWRVVHRLLVTVTVTLVFVSLECNGAHAFTCPKAIYAFGDSLTDNGNAQAEIPVIFDFDSAYPNGESYRFPKRPCERTRFCNGRLMIDFAAQAFGLPFLAPYSRHFDDSEYSHGVNFAISGAGGQDSLPPFSLEREVDNYFKFRAGFKGDDTASTAMHMIPEIGVNDFSIAFTAGLLSPEKAKGNMTDQILGAVKQSLETLHAGGARFIYVFNLPPVGCTPAYLTLFSLFSPKDEYGCLSAYNSVFKNFNEKLKTEVETYRQMWPDTVILAYDWYEGVYEVIRNQVKYGFKGDLRACCGGGGPYNFNPLAPCGPLATNVCTDTEHTVFWDDIHCTEAFNRLMVTFALTGKFVDGPPEAVNLKAACNLDFSSFKPQTVPNPLSPACK